MSSVKARVDLEHHVWKIIKEHQLQDKRILVALSGGADSVALLRILAKVHRNTSACYFHHGEDSNTEYRKEAQLFCENLCKKLDVSFFILKSAQMAKTEAQYRELRYAALKKLLKTEQFFCVALGHHRDDLLETRLLRLIRGTGGQGLLAMDVLREKKFRPFLDVPKSELIKYLRSEKIKFIEDPSNKALDPMRNWLRAEWLPQLEKRQKGAIASLARSLELVAQECEERRDDFLLQNEAYKSSQGDVISRAFYLSLGSQHQRRLIAQYLLSLGKRDFSQAQIEEIHKRLDNSQKVIRFKVAGCEWEINAEQIKVQS